MTTKKPCIILYSYNTINETGSAMTCRGLVDPVVIRSSWKDLAIDVRNIFLSDKFGNPMPGDAIIWDVKIIE